MTNILITGITGFVGSHLALHLSNNKENEIFGLYRSIRPESTFNALELGDKNNINLVLGDISSFTSVQEIMIDADIDQIYHFAAQAIVKKASKSPLPTYYVNVLGTLNILENLRLISRLERKEIPTLVMSSDKAYGTSEILPYEENMRLNGLDIYSSSKACEDIIARSFAYSYDLPIVVARPCNIFGDYDFNWSRIIPQFIKAYMADEKITIIKNTADQLREYVYIEDLARALEMLIQNIQKTKGEAFNITSTNSYSVYDIIKMFSKATGYDNMEYVKKDKGFKEIEKQILECEKLIDLVGWYPKYELNEELLKNIIENYRKWFLTAKAIEII